MLKFEVSWGLNKYKTFERASGRFPNHGPSGYLIIMGSLIYVYIHI